MIRQLPFQRLVRYIAESIAAEKAGDPDPHVIKPGEIRFQQSALEALQTVAERMLMELFEDAYRITACSKRVTLMLRDLHAAEHFYRRIYNIDPPGSFVAGIFPNNP
jgi:histone H3/H4